MQHEYIVQVYEYIAAGKAKRMMRKKTGDIKTIRSGRHFFKTSLQRNF